MILHCHWKEGNGGTRTSVNLLRLLSPKPENSYYASGMTVQKKGEFGGAGGWFVSYSNGGSIHLYTQSAECKHPNTRIHPSSNSYQDTPIGPKPLFTLSLKWKRVGITAIQVFVRRIKDKWWWEALKWAMFTYQKGLFALVIRCFQGRLLISHRTGEELESMKECIMGPMRK